MCLTCGRAEAYVSEVICNEADVSGVIVSVYEVVLK